VFSIDLCRKQCLQSFLLQQFIVIINMQEFMQINSRLCYHYRQHKKTDEIVHKDETLKAVTPYSYITVLFTTTTNIILDLQSLIHQHSL